MGFFFYQGFLHRHWWFTGQQGREETIFYSTLPLPPACEHSDIYLQLCMWDDYHTFLIATLVFTRLLLDEIYHIIELPFEWLIDDAMFVSLFTWWIDTRFLLQRFDIGNRWIWNRIDYHPCIRSEPTNQVCYSPPKFLRNSCNSWAITLKTHPSSNSHSESQESFSSLDDRCWIRPSSIWNILLSSCSTDGSTTNKRVQWLQTIFSIFKCLRNICSAPATWNILFLFRCGHVIVEINKSFRMNWF